MQNYNARLATGYVIAGRSFGDRGRRFPTTPSQQRG